ncbi:4'-phosphopantetheinyl transferase superfamily protein [Streptomyces sp. NPDC052101]|uniref:4'-phosphopantetheinyl transferase family protein n=1 Tax=Streptomyces sp. NPDC052101 TaxID=3155763 RepID=UPI00344A5704
MTAPPPTIPRPVRIGSPRSWSVVHDDLARLGTAVLYAPADAWRRDERDETGLRRLLGRDWDRYLSFGHPGLRRQFVASRALLKQAAAVALRLAPEDIELAYGPSGRPYLRGFDQIDLSLSHTDDILLVGMTTRGLIGVDVERSDRPLYGPGLGRQICTPHELKQLARLPEQRRNAELVRLWTLKEAYSKAIGQGMRFRFTQFGFATDPADGRVLRPDGGRGGEEWTLRTFALPEGYCASAVVENAGFGRLEDPAAATMLDRDLVVALTSALAEQPEAAAPPDDDPGKETPR